MIKGFNEQTAPLSEYELNTLLPIVAHGLQHKVGVKNVVSGKEICSGMNSVGFDINGARLRKIINHIRVNNIVSNLIATSRGYYVATDRKELEDYIASLQAREDAIAEVRYALQKQLSCFTI